MGFNQLKKLGLCSCSTKQERKTNIILKTYH
jgi:hypothetical protein